MPTGYSEAMHIFTKASKPVYEYLRRQVNLFIIFVDGSYQQGNTEQECLQKIQATAPLLGSLSLTIHKVKSIGNATQEIEFLGFVFYSVTITISIQKGKLKLLF